MSPLWLHPPTPLAPALRPSSTRRGFLLGRGAPVPNSWPPLQRLLSMQWWPGSYGKQCRSFDFRQTGLRNPRPPTRRPPAGFGGRYGLRQCTQTPPTTHPAQKRADLSCDHGALGLSEGVGGGGAHHWRQKALLRQKRYSCMVFGQKKGLPIFLSGLWRGLSGDFKSVIFSTGTSGTKS